MIFSSSPALRVRHFINSKPPLALAVLALSIAVPVGFVLYTNEVWEDFLITYRHSENLINGHGLVFTPGERVHGFTSPLNVLLPALFGWIVQARDFVLPLLGFRIISLIGLVVSLVAIDSVLREDMPPTGLRRALCGLFALLAVLEIKTVAFAMNGQEAGLMLGFLGPLFVVAYRGWTPSSVKAGGVCIAGLMYTRPDAFVHVLAAAVAGFVFHSGSRREYAASFIRSAAIGLALYLPWLCFAQIYYGSFVPHTITAKSGTDMILRDDLGFLASAMTALRYLPARI